MRRYWIIRCVSDDTEHHVLLDGNKWFGVDNLPHRNGVFFFGGGLIKGELDFGDHQAVEWNMSYFKG